MVDDTPPPDLVVSGGGRIIVATDELLAQAAGLDRLSVEIGTATTLVLRATARIPDHLLVDAPYGVRAAGMQTTEALVLLRRCQQDSEGVATLLHTAMALYGVTETAGEQLARALAARLSYTTGLLTPLLLLQVLPVLSASAAALVLAGMARGMSPKEAWQHIRAWAREQNGVLNDPLTVMLVRAGMGNSDDALGGILRLPPEIVALLGDEGAGITGLGSTAAIVAALARHTGLLRESGVAVTKTSTTAATAPRSLAERAARIPGAGVAAAAPVRVDRHTRRGASTPGEDTEQATQPATKPRPEPAASPKDQVRIDRYSSPGMPDRFEVYIAGTVDFSATATEEPWDMTSNVAGIAGLPAGSTAAVREAMGQAGITASSPVTLTGHSQGGLVASLIAASGDYTVSNVVTFGAPAGLVEIPTDVSVLNVRHSDDIVPALGGYDASPHALVVERELFGGTAVPADPVFPAHQMSAYRETAALIDDARSPQVRSALAELDAFARPDGRTPTAQSSTFHATRVPEEER